MPEQADEKFITIIIPAYNEGGSVVQTLRTVCAVVPYKEVIVVDDGSTS